MQKRRRNTEHLASQFTRLRRLRRWLIGLPLVAVAAIVLLWSVPVIVAHTSLRQSIVSAALSDFEGSVTIGSASLGWLSPLLAHDIEARDTRGQPLGHVKSLRSEKSLLGLLSDTSHPGVFRVEEPKLQVVLRPDGSNWEDALAKLLSEPSQGSAVQKLDDPGRRRHARSPRRNPGRPVAAGPAATRHADGRRLRRCRSRSRAAGVLGSDGQTVGAGVGRSGPGNRATPTRRTMATGS